MTRGFILTVQPLLFGGYVHGPQCPRFIAVKFGHLSHPGLLFMGGKRSKPIAPVGGVPKVQKGKKCLVDRERNAESENKAKTEPETNKPKTRVKNARPVKRFSHFHGGRK